MYICYMHICMVKEVGEPLIEVCICTYMAKAIRIWENFGFENINLLLSLRLLRSAVVTFINLIY
jgi:hypothetical protein